MSNKIGWCTDTLNPVVGCSPVSEGCNNCYAARMASRFCKTGEPFNGLVQRGFEIPPNGKCNPQFLNKTRFYPDLLEKPFHWKKTRRIFITSMGDLWHPSVTNEEIAEVFGVIAECPQHIFLDLTKRPERRLEWFDWLKISRTPFDHEYKIYLSIGNIFEKPLPNYWCGVSVENQKTADDRIPLLLQTPAAKRFMSYEPALEEIWIFEYFRSLKSNHVPKGPHGRNLPCPTRNKSEFGEWCSCGIDMVICGAETGPHKRHMNLDWARSVRDQCAASGVHFWFKKDSDGNETLDVVEHHPEFWSDK